MRRSALLLSKLATWLAAVAFAGLASGCATAAPVRTTGHGAPARLAKGQMEAAGAVSSMYAGGPMLGLAVADWLSLELTAEFSLSAWAMGGLTARFTAIRPTNGGKGPALDFEVGGGLGTGYIYSCISLNGKLTCGDDYPWREVLSYGGYAGVGFGWWTADWFCVYIRARSGINASTRVGYNIPIEGVLGIEFRLPKGVNLYLATGGYLAFLDRALYDNAYNFLIDFGLSIPFQVF